MLLSSALLPSTLPSDTYSESICDASFVAYSSNVPPPKDVFPPHLCNSNDRKREITRCGTSCLWSQCCRVSAWFDKSKQFELDRDIGVLWGEDSESRLCRLKCSDSGDLARRICGNSILCDWWVFPTKCYFLSCWIWSHDKPEVSAFSLCNKFVWNQQFLLDFKWNCEFCLECSEIASFLLDLWSGMLKVHEHKIYILKLTFNINYVPFARTRHEKYDNQS